MIKSTCLLIASFAASFTNVVSLPFLGGVNMAGYQLITYTNGTFIGSNGGNGSTPPVGQFAHFADQGVNVFRVRKWTFSLACYRASRLLL